MVRTQHLYTMTTTLSGNRDEIGDTPHGNRVIVEVSEGTFNGARMRGVILPGARDWALMRPDGVLEVDVRLTLKTHDNALVYVTYTGLVREARRAFGERARGITPDPASLYFRTAPRFETSDERYIWLNNILAIGIGNMPPDGVGYDVYEIL